LKKNKSNKSECCLINSNPYAGIAGAIIGPFIAIVALFAIFTPTQMSNLVFIALAFAIMGVFLGFDATKKNK